MDSNKSTTTIASQCISSDYMAILAAYYVSQYRKRSFASMKTGVRPAAPSGSAYSSPQMNSASENKENIRPIATQVSYFVK